MSSGFNYINCKFKVQTVYENTEILSSITVSISNPQEKFIPEIVIRAQNRQLRERIIPS